MSKNKKSLSDQINCNKYTERTAPVTVSSSSNSNSSRFPKLTIYIYKSLIGLGKTRIFLQRELKYDKRKLVYIYLSFILLQLAKNKTKTHIYLFFSYVNFNSFNVTKKIKHSYEKNNFLLNYFLLIKITKKETKNNVSNSI